MEFRCDIPAIINYNYHATSRPVGNFMRARIVAKLLGTMVLASLNFAGAQQAAKDTPRVGFIFSAGISGTSSPLFDAFQFRLRDLGYVEGKNILIDTSLCRRQIGSDARVCE